MQKKRERGRSPMSIGRSDVRSWNKSHRAGIAKTRIDSVEGALGGVQARGTLFAFDSHYQSETVPVWRSSEPGSSRRPPGILRIWIMSVSRVLIVIHEKDPTETEFLRRLRFDHPIQGAKIAT